ncbi:MAG: hypothetical protein AB1490_22390 [Pseudomonadota bacterium]
MPGLLEKIAVTVGSAFLAGALLVIAYVSGGVVILAFLLTGIFLIGGNVVPVGNLFAPIGFAALIVFGLSSWALATLGVGAWWVWKKKAPGAPKPPDAQP